LCRVSFSLVPIFVQYPGSAVWRLKIYTKTIPRYSISKNFREMGKDFLEIDGTGHEGDYQSGEM
jgi:hypothetical protein